MGFAFLLVFPKLSLWLQLVRKMNICATLKFLTEHTIGKITGQFEVNNVDAVAS